MFKKKKSDKDFSLETLESYIKKFDYNNALSYLEEFPDIIKNDDVVYAYYLGLLYLVKKEIPKQLENRDLQSLIEKYQYSGNNELMLGIYLYFYSNSEKYLGELLDLLELFGYYDDILNILNEKYSNSKDAFVLNKYGFVYWQKKEYKKALQYFKMSLVVNADPIVYNSIALIYNDLGDQILAEKYFKEGLKSFPDDFTLLTNYAVFLFNLGKFDKSNKIVKKIKELGLNVSFLHSGIGKILKPEYEINLEEELKREPKNNSLVLEIGKYLLRRGEIDKLIHFLRDEIDKGNNSPRIFSLLAYAYFYNNEFSKAELAISNGLQVHNDDLSLLITKVSIDIHRGKINSVLNTLKKIKNLDNMYIEALFNVAMILEGAGMNSKAKQFYEWYLDVSDNESTKMVAKWHLDVINSKLKINIKKEDVDEEFF